MTGVQTCALPIYFMELKEEKESNDAMKYMQLFEKLKEQTGLSNIADVHKSIAKLAGKYDGR